MSAQQHKQPMTRVHANGNSLTARHHKQPMMHVNISASSLNRCTSVGWYAVSLAAVREDANQGTCDWRFSIEPSGSMCNAACRVSRAL
jgi:hypothetical protein